MKWNNKNSRKKIIAYQNRHETFKRAQDQLKITWILYLTCRKKKIILCQISKYAVKESFEYFSVIYFMF
jgi:hypothetical protein